MTEPRSIRLSPDDNIVVAVDQIAPGAVRRRRDRARAHSARAQDGGGADRQGRAGAANSARSSALPRKTSRRAIGCTSTTSAMHDFARDYRFAEAAKNDEVLPPELQRDIRGLQAAERQDRHAQLHRHSHLGELLGLGREVHRRSVQPLGPPRGLSGDRRRRAVRARLGLRHGGVWRRLGFAAPHAMGLRHASQSRRRADGRPRLRGVPDRPHERRIRHGRGRSLPDHDHPGDRRHQEDRRRRRRAHQGDAADRGESEARNAVRPPKSRSLCNAAARTAIPASPPIRRSARRPICW